MPLIDLCVRNIILYVPFRCVLSKEGRHPGGLTSICERVVLSVITVSVICSLPVRLAEWGIWMMLTSHRRCMPTYYQSIIANQALSFNHLTFPNQPSACLALGLVEPSFLRYLQRGGQDNR